MPLIHQLIVLPTHADAQGAGLSAVERARVTCNLSLRDAAALTSERDGIGVTELNEGWPGRRALGPLWWSALSWAIVGSCQDGRRALIEATVSRSFLAEVAQTLASGLAAVARVAERVDTRSLLRDVAGPPFVRVIYGSLPQSAIDDLCDRAVEG
jgi:hypothetical protein